MGLGGKPSDLIGQLERSEIDMAWTVAGYTPGRFPKLAVFELPWIGSSRAAVTSMALQEYYETYARDELESVHTLAVWCYPSGVIMSKQREVFAPGDLRGMKIRTPSAPVGLMLSHLGAEPKQLSPLAVPGELDKGDLDATLFPYEALIALPLAERVHYISEFAGDRGLFTSVFILGMSHRSYQQLPPDLRRIIDEHSGMKLSEEAGRLWDEFEMAGRYTFEASGGTVNFIKGQQYDEWYGRTEPAIAEWIQEQNRRGIDGGKLIASAKGLVEKYGRLWIPY